MSLSLADLSAVGVMPNVDAPFGVRRYLLARKGHSIAKGLHRGMRMGRRLGRHRRGLQGLGDVISDAQTWIDYGNEILGRSSASGVGAEAEKAGMNIDTFVGHRGDELSAASQDKLDELLTMKMNLLNLAAGKYTRVDPGVMSIAKDAIQDAADEAAFRAKAGAAGVAAAPGAVYGFVKEEGKKLIDYAINKGGDVAQKAALPLGLIVAGVLGVAYIMYKK